MYSNHGEMLNQSTFHSCVTGAFPCVGACSADPLSNYFADRLCLWFHSKLCVRVEVFGLVPGQFSTLFKWGYKRKLATSYFHRNSIPGISPMSPRSRIVSSSCGHPPTAKEPYSKIRTELGSTSGICDKYFFLVRSWRCSDLIYWMSYCYRSLKYSSMQGGTYGKVIRFRVKNLNNQAKLYRHDFRPVFLCPAVNHSWKPIRFAEGTMETITLSNDTAKRSNTWNSTMTLSSSDSVTEFAVATPSLFSHSVFHIAIATYRYEKGRCHF